MSDSLIYSICSLKIICYSVYTFLGWKKTPLKLYITDITYWCTSLRILPHKCKGGHVFDVTFWLFVFLASCRYLGYVPEPHYGPEVVPTEQETWKTVQGSGVMATTQPIVLLVELSFVRSSCLWYILTLYIVIIL